MDKSRAYMVETGEGDPVPGLLAPLFIHRWLTSGLQRVFTAPLSIIWKPQICRINSKFLNFKIDLSYQKAQALSSKWVHPPMREFSAASVYFSLNPTLVHDVSSAWMGLLHLCAWWAPIYYLKHGLNGSFSGTCLSQWHDCFVLWLFWHPLYITLLE